MKALRKVIDGALERLVVFVMGALVVDVLWQVFTRFVLADPSSYTEELARYLLIWVGLLGAAYASGKNMHLALDLLPAKLTGNRLRMLKIVIELCVIAFSIAVLLIGGTRLVWVTFRLGQTSAALGVPLGYVYMVVPVTGALMTFYSLDRLIRSIRDGGDTTDSKASADVSRTLD